MSKKTKKVAFKKPRKSLLIETWLTLKWELNKISDNPVVLRDANFPLALGLFYERVKDKFPNKIELDINKAPLELFPYRPRFQFRSSSNKHLMQIGPGVASVNYLGDYSWQSFLDDSLYLRKKLIQVYKETDLKLIAMNLSYKNAVPFEYSLKDLQTFLKEKLNTSVILPEKIPGKLSKTKSMSNINLQTGFDLSDPIAVAVLMIATGGAREKDDKTGKLIEKENLIINMEVESSRKNAPDVNNKKAYELWLNKAHGVLESWFLSLTEGDLSKQFLTKQ